MTTRDFAAEGFLCTDPDTNQWTKQIAPNRFRVIESGIEYDVDLLRFSDAKIHDIVQAYYDSLEDLKRAAGENWRQWLAEIIAESGYGVPASTAHGSVPVAPWEVIVSCTDIPSAERAYRALSACSMDETGGIDNVERLDRIGLLVIAYADGRSAARALVESALTSFGESARVLQVTEQETDDGN